MPKWDDDPERPTEGTERLAEFVTRVQRTELPPEAVEAAKRHILDTLGVMLAGTVEPPARSARALAEMEGGHSLAAVVGTGLRTSTSWAAFANGVAGHALDYDDTNFVMIGHPSVPVVSAALALGELVKATGGDLIRAYLVGVEVAVRLGRIMNPAHYERGYHATGTLGTMGAAAAGAALLGLEAEATRRCFGIAASEAGGLKENFGTMTKPFHAGQAARNGVVAALLARQGFTASPHILEASQGFLCVLESETLEVESALASLGRPWEITGSGLAVKRYPCCAETQAGLDIILALRLEHGILPELVEEVEVGLAPWAAKVLIHHNPQTGLEGKFSMEFCAAAALVEGRVGVGTFTDARVQDPVIRDLMGRGKVTYLAELEVQGGMSAGAVVSLRLKNGQTLHRRATVARGHPTAPLALEDLKEKFRDCASRVLLPERVEGTLALVLALDRLSDISLLTAALS